jgi:hypothetical protein
MHTCTMLTYYTHACTCTMRMHYCVLTNSELCANILYLLTRDCIQGILFAMPTMWMVPATFNRCNLKAGGSSERMTLMWMMLA